MLKQIRCDKFLQKVVDFHPGLNAVVGDNIASNSIGKSMMLMIIDFVFGGESYITKNRDAIKNIGEHEFKFIFEFNNKKYFFKRSTATYKHISLCDEHFTNPKEIHLNLFTKFLQEQYECVLDSLSFREMLGRYFRIYGKENLNEKKPIQFFDKEKSKISIDYLLKFFDNYEEIKHLENELSNKLTKIEILDNARKNDLMPIVDKDVYATNKSNLLRLENRLNKLQQEAIQSTLDINAILSNDILEIKNKKSELVIQLNMQKNRLKRIDANLHQRSVPVRSELKKLIEYFPSINVEKINEVEAFHESIAKNLENELMKAKSELTTNIGFLENEISILDQTLYAKLSIKDAPRIAVNSIVELAFKIKDLKYDNNYFEQETQFKEGKKQITAALKEIRSKSLAEIVSQVNQKMMEINSRIYNDDRRPPVLSINGDSYRFDTFDDTGTGTAYVNLITFDLSILQLTCLPALAHDLPLLKNIENNALANLIKIYAQSYKQIFIAIDKMTSYDAPTNQTIESAKVLQLSKDMLLFGKNWKKPVEV